jgi:hypothetical protein
MGTEMTGLVEARRTMMIYSVGVVIQNTPCKARPLLSCRGIHSWRFAMCNGVEDQIVHVTVYFRDNGRQ